MPRVNQSDLIMRLALEFEMPVARCPCQEDGRFPRRTNVGGID